MLHNAVGVGCFKFAENNVTEMYGSTLLLFRGSGWVSYFQKQLYYVTLEQSLPSTVYTMQVQTQLYITVFV